MFTLAHTSDWHGTTLEGAGLASLLNKRLSGWLSWKLRRRKIYRSEVLTALFEDLRHQRPDHVAVTGDLTNVALAQEFVEAGQQLARLGHPDWVFLVPGNHDAYVEISRRSSWDHWAEYMRSDADAVDPLPDGGESTGDPTHPKRRAPTQDEFPTLRIRDDVALVGVCTSEPTPLFHASGSVGTQQLQRLEGMLAELGERELCRVVLIHHPPTDESRHSRRRLTDAAAVRQTLARTGAELVLCGHDHRTRISELAGPTGSIPVVGVRSSSYRGRSSRKRAQYHLYRIERTTAPSSPLRYRIELLARTYDPTRNCFVSDGSPHRLGEAPSGDARSGDVVEY